MTTRLPRFYSIDPVRDVQGARPDEKRAKRGLGALNRLLQEQLNPPSKHKKGKGDRR